MKQQSFIESATTLVDNVPSCNDMMAQLAHKLCEAINILQAIKDQANAQFKVGDTHATFSKQTLEALGIGTFLSKDRRFINIANGFSDGVVAVIFTSDGKVYREFSNYRQIWNKNPPSINDAIIFVQKGKWKEV